MESEVSVDKTEEDYDTNEEGSIMNVNIEINLFSQLKTKLSNFLNFVADCIEDNYNESDVIAKLIRKVLMENNSTIKSGNTFVSLVAIFFAYWKKLSTGIRSAAAEIFSVQGSESPIDFKWSHLNKSEFLYEAFYAELKQSVLSNILSVVMGRSTPTEVITLLNHEISSDPLSWWSKTFKEEDEDKFLRYMDLFDFLLMS